MFSDPFMPTDEQHMTGWFEARIGGSKRMKNPVPCVIK
jgi:hypothetical protein